MFEREINTYEEVLKAYRQRVTDRMALADLREYNEILFSSHSCAIEGNPFSVNDTRELKEKGLNVIPQGRRNKAYPFHFYFNNKKTCRLARFSFISPPNGKVRSWPIYPSTKACAWRR